MLRTIFVAVTLIGATGAQAQQFPGVGPLYGTGTIQGDRSYNDWQQTRRDHGLDYDTRIDRPRDTYQPYFDATPHYDPYRSRSPYSPYGNDD